MTRALMYSDSDATQTGLLLVAVMRHVAPPEVFVGNHKHELHIAMRRLACAALLSPSRDVFAEALQDENNDEDVLM